MFVYIDSLFLNSNEHFSSPSGKELQFKPFCFSLKGLVEKDCCELCDGVEFVMLDLG